MRVDLLFFLLVLLMAMFGEAMAWDAVGDTLALLVGLALLFCCICAGIGWWSRR